jgi:ribonucleoside-diphosphate reductase alpha chain
MKIETHDIGKNMGWKVGIDFPEWGNNALYLTTIKGGYLIDGETPKDGYVRVSSRAAELLNKPELQERFFDILWKGWLIPSTPVMANLGTDVALPISCFSSHVGDSMYEIYRKNLEMAMLSKYGGGTAYDFSSIRAMGTKIKDGRGGTSDGIIPFIKSYDSTILASKQGKCYIEGTEVLTNFGFVDFRNITSEHLLAQVEDNRDITFTKDYELVNYNINEKLDFYSGKKRSNLINLTVTKNHRMVIEKLKTTFKTIDGKRVKTSKNWSNKLEIVESNNFKPHKDNRIHVGGFLKGDNKELTPFEEFMIAYQADGAKTYLTNNEGFIKLHFHLKKERKIIRLVNILEKCNFEYSIVETKENSKKIYINVPEIYVQETFSWVNLNNVSYEWCNLFLEELAEWDSHKKANHFLYSSINKININYVQAISSLANKRTTYSDIQKDGNRKLLYTLTIWNDYKAIGGDSFFKKEIDYNGSVYCAVVPNGKLIIRSNNVVSICGNTRRGAVAIYLNAEHGEFKEFLEVREPKGDVNRQSHNIHQGAIFTNEFMHKVVDKNGKEREIWLETLKKRVKTGEPYTMFIDNANNAVPEWWHKNDLKIRHSNLCSEIFLPTDENHTLVCCLSSLNLVKFDEWRNTDTVYLSVLFLDAVMEDFLQKGNSDAYKGIEDAVRFATKSRALGLGALGWHSFLQSKLIPFVSIEANSWTSIIFKYIKEESEKATMDLAKEYGEPEWCQGTGRRNLTLLAIAPNRSSSKLAGGYSQGVEPIAANIYMDDDAKGLHIRRNPFLEQLLESKGKNVPQVWDAISEDKGSVLNVRCMSSEEKAVFKTFKEINQLELVRQAGIRQKYIDQGQSLNLAFFNDAPAKFINQVHIEAWKLGLKSLYYLRSESVLRADTKEQRDLYSECIMCEG